ncbi:MAG: TonB family protein [Terriglobales bacterium]
MPEPTSQRAAAQASGAQYRRRMLLALMILLTALVVMLVKDRSFWFGGEEMAASDETPITMAASVSSVSNETAPAASSTVAPATTVKKQQDSKHQSQPSVEGASVVATERGVLAPLEVEVVNGKTRHTVRPDASAVKVDMQSGAPARELPPVTDAVQRTQIDATKTQLAEPSYPSLAGQMKVQGSVLLQALISAEGVIQEVRVISGPAILSSAAREAAMQWRFKPYLENGKAVETQARITVNFVIKVWDDEARVHEPSPTQTAQATRPGE